MTTTDIIRLAFFVPVTEAEGPGKRFALWVQGCTLGCVGCCNPQMWSKEGGRDIGVDSLFSEIKKVSHLIEGVSFLGGEPFQQAETMAILARRIKAETDLTIMVYSGYDLEEVEGSEFLKYIDVLVAGRYIKELHTTKRRWVGSTNQTVHFLTSAYAPDDPRFREPNHAELRLNNRGELTIVGFPFDSLKKFRV